MMNIRLLLECFNSFPIFFICCDNYKNNNWVLSPSASDLQFDNWQKAGMKEIPLGNATVGALVWQRDSALRFSLDRTDLWDLRPMDSISGPNNRFSWVYSQVQKGDYLPVQKKYDWPLFTTSFLLLRRFRSGS